MSCALRIEQDGGKPLRTTLMHLDFSEMSPRDAYRWMIHTILPRPIAWVSTLSNDGRSNLAPFSFFQGITANPPTLMFVPVNSRHGEKKDTVRNIEAVPEFVVNLVTGAMGEAMNRTSATLPYGESEFERFGIESSASSRVRPCRVAGAPVAFECTLDRIINIGEGPLAANVIFGRIVSVHVDDSVLAPDGLPDPRKLDLIGRMGGDEYSKTQDIFSMERPS